MDIVSIQLSLTEGDLITLWAPRWREDGEEWEGFLGNEEAIHAFPDTAALAAYVRTVAEHDLTDHPAWPLVQQLTVAELVPEEDHCYDVIGAPEIVADEPDTWTVSELAGITTVVRSLADTCELAGVHDVLNAAEGFGLLERGTWSFSGREGGKLWAELAETVADRWDEVIDALDAIVQVPEVDPEALVAARRELAAVNGSVESTGSPNGSVDGSGKSAGNGNGLPSGSGNGSAASAATATAGPAANRGGSTATRTATAEAEHSDGELSEAAAFWEEVGIDPILISTEDGDFYTLRCYLNDNPVFLGAKGRIDVLPSARALARHLAGDGADDHDLTRTSTWPDVVAKATSGELAIEVDPQNTYQLSGLGEDLAHGPLTVDPNQLDLAVELLLDVGTWAGDESAALALAPSQSLGWLTSFVLRPDPTRLAPSPPFDAEAARWNSLVEEFVRRLRRL
jgi:hypothetical protein